ncbi:DNAJ heat shock amino-terminal domain protein [Medicago truncatula]|nr:DNAJ heat shock amino-terminal domain protein [Medicago truncatula]
MFLQLGNRLVRHLYGLVPRRLQCRLHQNQHRKVKMENRLYGGCVDICATGVGKQHKDEKSKDGYVPVSKPMESQASNSVGSKRVRQPENYEDEDYDISSKKPRQNRSFNNDEVEKNNMSEETFLRNTIEDEHSYVQGDKVYLDCPDPDFNNFEKETADDCFAVNQFWAVYDTTDAMPRFYALVKKVTFPFKMHITWLEADPDKDSDVHSYNAGLPIACGKFKLGKSQKTTARGMFSHQILCIKGSGKGSYLVFPKKGETWAIFTNWSSNPENFRKREFAYVEILSDFAENVGVQVAYLGKVRGFISLFEKTRKNGANTFHILPNELYKFSHRVPSYKMSVDERKDVPKDCFELDTAALPTDIFEAEKNSSILGRSREKV